jgi:hypothetical protein
VRRSVTIGFGLWLVAVVTVALVASVAIQTAGRQVTSVQITAALPETSSSPSLDPEEVGEVVVIDSPPVRVSSAPSASPPADSAGARPTAKPPGAGPRSPFAFGTFDTDGGRLRVRCSGDTVSLDGGYVRPEPGWAGRVDVPGSTMIVALFWSRAQVITVAARCRGGRPAFTQQILLMRNGAPPPPAAPGELDELSGGRVTSPTPVARSNSRHAWMGPIPGIASVETDNPLLNTDLP